MSADAATRPWRDESRLRELYCEQGLTISEIATRFGCSDWSVRDGMVQHGIPRRDAAETPGEGTPWRDKTVLEEKYLAECEPIGSIADDLGCSAPTVRDWLKKHGLFEERPNGTKYPRLYDQEWLRDQYCRLKKNSRQISRELGCSKQQVLDGLERAGIERRDGSGAYPPESPLRRDDFDYGEGWNDEKKTRARERDGYKCQGCGMSQGEHISECGTKLHVHHIVPAKEFDGAQERNRLDNLVTLCSSCHGLAERMAPLNPFSD